MQPVQTFALPLSHPLSTADSLTTPIVQTATYTFQDTAELIAYQEGRYGSYEYGRYGNPTTRACEEKIRELEGAEDCLVSSSGMNAATTMLLALVPAGGHIVTTTDCYRRTRQVRGWGGCRAHARWAARSSGSGSMQYSRQCCCITRLQPEALHACVWSSRL